jgi:hypothetical protein
VQVARRNGNEEWHRFARSLLDDWVRRAAESLDLGVRDAILCHGATGIAHIFNRLYQTEGDLRCRPLAIAWYERALEMRQQGRGVAGFEMYTRPEDSDVCLALSGRCYPVAKRRSL